MWGWRNRWKYFLAGVDSFFSHTNLHTLSMHTTRSVCMQTHVRTHPTHMRIPTDRHLHPEPIIFPQRRWVCIFHKLSDGILFRKASGGLVCSITPSIYFPSHTAASDLTLWLIHSSTHDSTPPGGVQAISEGIRGRGEAPHCSQKA